MRPVALDDSRRNPTSQAGFAASHTLAEASEVARELHDGLAQTLFAIASAAKELREREPREAETILELSQSASRELREAFHSLRGAGSVSRRGLGAALAELRDEAPGVAVDVAVDRELREARDGVAELLYRACREGVVNASRHAEASRCRVRCGVAGTAATATVADDGKGLGDARRGFGLRFLAEALEGAGGTLEVVSSRSGTLLTARVPIAS